MTSGPNPGPDITGELAGQEPTQHDPEVGPDGSEPSANSPQGVETGNAEALGVPQPSQAQEGEDPDDDTQGHRYLSDENLKQAIEQLSGALAALREIGAWPEPALNEKNL
jgi:hypothetical protein